MRQIDLGTVDAVENTAGVELDQPTADTTLVVLCDAFNGTLNIASSPDNSTWTDVAGTSVVEAGSDRTHMIAFKSTNKFVRVECTARSAGSAEVKLLAPY